jgi:CBS domain-containing protein
MDIGEVCNREVVFVTADAPVREAAGLMARYHVGDLVVAVERGGQRVPVGILTDRDVAVAVVARGLDPEAAKVGDVMTKDLATAREDEGIWDVVRRMRERGVRRLPVVNALGGLEGLVTADDLLDLLAGELSDLARLALGQPAREGKSRGAGAP